VSDKYRETKTINVRQPAIVLMHPEDTGSLLREPVTAEQRQTNAYWRKRAFIYVMGPDEYFHKRQRTDQDNQPPSNPSSGHDSTTDSSMTSNEERTGGQDDIDDRIKRVKEHNTKK
ncbi:unnamed protein product, partial [Adineta ricciae]